jgi:hypothetical protein
MRTILFNVVSILAFRFAAVPRSKSSLSRFSINWPFCADSDLDGPSFQPWIGGYGRCYIGSGRRSSTR